MRRLLATTAIAALTLGVGTASAFTPAVGEYVNGPSASPRVSFINDGHHVRNYSSGNTQFSSVPLEHHTNSAGHIVWSFHSQSEHWRVNGHWVGSQEVHGSICNLEASPGGCPEGEHLQHYQVHLYSKQ